MPLVNSRVDALCHCVGSLLLIATTQHVRDQDAHVRPDSGDAYHDWIDSDAEPERTPHARSTYCTAAFEKGCDCFECKPTDEEFNTHILLWDWTQKHATSCLTPRDATYYFKTGNNGQTSKGTANFNRVFTSIPVAIHVMLCLPPVSDTGFQWVCGSRELSLYECSVESSRTVANRELSTTGPLACIPHGCSVTVEHLLWIERKGLFVIAVRGGGSSLDAVDFQGCILLYAYSQQKLEFQSVVCEHQSIIKNVDAHEWFLHDFDDMLFFMDRRRRIQDGEDSESGDDHETGPRRTGGARLRTPAEHVEKIRRVDTEERQSIENKGRYIVRQPRVTVRVSGLCSSADEAYIFAATPKTSETQQLPRVTGRPRSERLPATELRTRALSDGDELFSTLLLQISIGTAEVVRVVEVPGSLPQFSHLLWKAFDYDAAADIFVVGSKVIVNPFPALQSWSSSLVAPIHAARPHTTWEHKHRGLVHPHPQAHAFQELPPAEKDPPYSLASCACFARVDDVGLCIISATQRTSLNLVWQRSWENCPGGKWRCGDYFGYIASDTYQWLPRSGAVQGMPFVSRWALQENFTVDPAAFVRLAQATAATSNPYEVWNRKCEQQAMSDADVAATRYEQYQLAARVRSDSCVNLLSTSCAMFLNDNDVMHAPMVQRSWQLTARGDCGRQTCVTKDVSWIVPRNSVTCYGLDGFDREDPGWRRDVCRWLDICWYPFEKGDGVKVFVAAHENT